MWLSNVFSCICLCVGCTALTFESLDLESLFWYTDTSSGRVHNPGHQVKVKVTGAKSGRVFCSGSEF